ncbi:MULTISPECIES: ArsC family reductase [Leeia]|uniref:ArsC family reductase n=1 Tax=Leeia aquatica TaxID=2725557 RepID=A0A847S2D7_9NEIS|nr:ArsC family reductase [Leeia aquatica]NLR73904.1 ArsC family reductase [Leeia aquatica]
MMLYGIPNCNTVKKARDWLSAQGHAVPFHDFKKQGVTEALLREWLQQQPWEKLVNRAGTTWRQLPDEAKAAITGAEQAIALMLDKPSVIKRPVLVKDGRVTLGFDPDTYTSLFA